MRETLGTQLYNYKRYKDACEPIDFSDTAIVKNSNQIKVEILDSEYARDLCGRIEQDGGC